MRENKTVIAILLAGLIIGLFSFFSPKNEMSVGKLQSKIELSKESSYLFNPQFNPNMVKVYGVSIGDSQNVIAAETISESQNSAGWIHTKNGVGYRIASGQVVEIVLQWKETKRIGLMREDEIFIRFGKADKVEDRAGLLAGGRDYFYVNRGLIVRYSTNGISINIIGK
jgi:hypothetical protein